MGMMNKINIDVEHHIIKTDTGWKAYLDNPTTLQLYNEWNDFITIVTHVETLKIQEKENGTMVLFVCNDDLAEYLAFTKVFIPTFSTKCTIKPYTGE